MNYVTKLCKTLSFFSAFMFGSNVQSISSKIDSKKIAPSKIYIIVGSTRNTTTGKQIAQNVQELLAHRTDIITQIISISDYQLPFYTNEVSPASRKGEIIDPVLKQWSECIAQADGFIIVSPEYNGGYPAPLKNALDSLYQEWNNKPVGFVGYSGGPAGGASMIAQLQQVVERLEMIPVATSIKIPQSWRAFGQQGHLVHAQDIAKELNMMVDELVKVCHT